MLLALALGVPLLDGVLRTGHSASKKVSPVTSMGLSGMTVGDPVLHLSCSLQWETLDCGES